MQNTVGVKKTTQAATASKPDKASAPKRPPPAKRSRTRVLILGGGFAGLSAAQALNADRCEVTLVDSRPDFEFLPNIHELLSAVKTPQLLRLPLADTLHRAGHRFVRDSVTGIDTAQQQVATQRRRRALGYDALIVALGGVDATHGVPGVREHAHAFKSVEQCSLIARRLDRLAARRKAFHVVIVGGGIEGVEALGEILRRHRHQEALSVTLVEANERLLPEAPVVLDAHLRGLCKPYAVSFEMGLAVRRIHADAVELIDGRHLPCDLTIWTGGPAPSPLLAGAGLAVPGAWAPVHDSLQSTLDPWVLVAGDAAALPKPVAKQAYHALDMGACAAGNAERLLGGGTLQPFRPSPKPILIAFGDLGCYLVAGRRVLAGVGLAAGKEAVYEWSMAQLDAQPWWRRVPGMAQRSQRAAHRLLWPSLSSLTSLRRQAQVSILSLG